MDYPDALVIGHRFPDLPLLSATLDADAALAGASADTATSIGETLFERHAGTRFVVMIAPVTRERGRPRYRHASPDNVAPADAREANANVAATPDSAESASVGTPTDIHRLPVIRVATLDSARHLLAETVSDPDRIDAAISQRVAAGASPDSGVCAVASAAQLERLRRDAGAKADGTLWLPIDERGFIRAVVTGSEHAPPATLDPALQLHRERSARAFPPPILVVPNVLSAALCNALIARLASDARPSGFLQPASPQAENDPQLLPDPRRKNRLDHWLDDPTLLDAVQQALGQRLLPAISRAFQFRVRQHEGFKVVAYHADQHGHFSRHRDNTAPDVRHRRFALSLGLSDGYAGGELVFPEYDDRGVRLRRGEAVVFSCGLLHEVRSVTAGARHALISFFW